MRGTGKSSRQKTYPVDLARLLRLGWNAKRKEQSNNSKEQGARSADYARGKRSTDNLFVIEFSYAIFHFYFLILGVVLKLRAEGFVR